MNLLKKHPGGRPKSPNPKMHDIKVRVDDQMYDQVHEYASTHHLTIAETVRRAIGCLTPKREEISDDMIIEAFNSFTTLHTDDLIEEDLAKIKELLSQLDNK